jgi:hypothetical protein
MKFYSEGYAKFHSETKGYSTEEGSEALVALWCYFLQIRFIFHLLIAQIT